MRSSIFRTLTRNFSQFPKSYLSNSISSKPTSLFILTTFTKDKKLGKALYDMIEKYDLPEESTHIFRTENLDSIKNKKSDSSSVILYYTDGRGDDRGHITEFGETHTVAEYLLSEVNHEINMIALSCNSASTFAAGTLSNGISLLTLTGQRDVISHSMAEYNLDILGKFISQGASPRQIFAALTILSPDVMYFEDARVKSSGNFNMANPYHPKKAVIAGSFNSEEIEEILKQTSISKEKTQRITNLFKRSKDIWQYDRDFSITSIKIILTTAGIDFDPEFEEALDKRSMHKLSLSNIYQHQFQRGKELFPDVFAQSESSIYGNIFPQFEDKESKAHFSDNFLPALFNMLVRRKETEYSVRNLCKLYPYLVNHNDKNYYTNLGNSIKFGHPAVSIILIEAGADINNIYSDPKGKETALMAAIFAKNNTVAKYLIEKYPSKDFIDKQSKNGSTALMLAVEQDNVSLVELLLKCSPNLNLRNNKDMTALDIAETKLISDMLKLAAEKTPKPSPIKASAQAEKMVKMVKM